MKTLSDKNRFIFLILFVAIIVRIGIFFGALSDDTFGILRFDEIYYHDLAFQWANGDFSGPEGAFIMSPLWSALLALIYATVGDSIIWTLLLQQFLGIVSTIFIFLIARQIMPIKWAFWTGILYTFIGPVLFYETVFSPDTLVTTTLIASTWSILVWKENFSQQKAALAGFIIGSAILARPSALLLLLGVATIVAVTLLRNKSEQKNYKNWLSLAIFLFCAGLVVSPVTIRNKMHGDPVLVTTGGPLNLYIGNGPNADGTWRPPDGWQFGIEEEEEVPEKQELIRQRLALQRFLQQVYDQQLQ